MLDNCGQKILVKCVTAHNQEGGGKQHGHYQKRYQTKTDNSVTTHGSTFQTWDALLPYSPKYLLMQGHISRCPVVLNFFASKPR
jgi:hypothetical protein